MSCAVKNGTDFDVVGLHGVKNQMGLEAETSIACRELIHLLADQRKVGEKSNRSDQAGVVRFSLIFAELALAEVVNINQIGSGTLR